MVAVRIERRRRRELGGRDTRRGDATDVLRRDGRRDVAGANAAVGLDARHGDLGALPLDDFGVGGGSKQTSHPLDRWRFLAGGGQRDDREGYEQGMWCGNGTHAGPPGTRAGALRPNPGM
jgi:hypothetical protein